MSEKYEIEKKILDKGIFSWHFNMKYKILRTLGLNLYSAFAFTIGVAFTLGIIQLM